MFEKNMKFPLLLDTYGILLTERKREILDYYYNDDYSLSEISELTGISRQGVRDSIKKSEEELYGYEAKLNIVGKYEKASELCDRLRTSVLHLAEKHPTDDFTDILSIIERLKVITNTLSADTPETRE